MSDPQQQPINSDNSLTVTTTDAPVNMQSGNSNNNNPAPPTGGQNINVQDFINQTSTEIGNTEAAKKARDEKKALLNRAAKSLNKVATNRKINVTTNEVIAEYIEYIPDNQGKSVYDYMKDPEVSRHIEFVFPNGKQEGDVLEEPITIYWKDPIF
jgi:hypothetical protein